MKARSVDRIPRHGEPEFLFRLTRQSHSHLRTKLTAPTRVHIGNTTAVDRPHWLTKTSGTFFNWAE